MFLILMMDGIMTKLEYMIKLKEAREATWEIKKGKEMREFKDRLIFLLFVASCITWGLIYIKGIL